MCKLFNRQEAGARGEINYPFHMFTPNQFLRGRTSSFGSEVEVKEGEESQKRHSELTQQLQQHQQHQQHQHQQQQQQGQGHGQGQGQGHGQGQGDVQDEYPLGELVPIVPM